MIVYCVRRSVEYEIYDIISIHETPEGAIKKAKEEAKNHNSFEYWFAEIPNEEIFGLEKGGLKYTVEEWEVKE